jgi:predicted PurR-regulated permease PerM
MPPSDPRTQEELGKPPVKRPHTTALVESAASSPQASNDTADSPALDGESQPRLLSIRMPVDVRGVSLTVIAIGVTIGLLKYMSEVFIPLVLAALTFYALDPVVDRLQRWRIPRAIGAALGIMAFVGSVGYLAFTLSDDVTQVIGDLPAATQKLRATLRATRAGESPGALDRLQQAADELQKTAQEAAGASPERGVMKVEVAEPVFSATAYVWWGSTQGLVLASQAIMILFLAYFLLLSDDLFKRKLVEIIGPTLERKKITVQILNEVASQIERFLMVQIFTSVVVGSVTWIVLWLLGINNPGVWGVVAGVFNSIPYFGPLIVTAVLSVVAFVQFETVHMALVTGGLALIITTLEGWFLTPTLMGRVAQVNTVAVFAGLIFWSWMWGMAGLLLAVPITMAIKATCDRVENLQPIGSLIGE